MPINEISIQTTKLFLFHLELATQILCPKIMNIFRIFSKVTGFI